MMLMLSVNVANGLNQCRSMQKNTNRHIDSSIRHAIKPGLYKRAFFIRQNTNYVTKLPLLRTCKLPAKFIERCINNSRNYSIGFVRKQRQLKGADRVVYLEPRTV